MSGAEDIAAISRRLREIAAGLRSDDPSEASADELAREAAELVTRAGDELDRALEEAESGEAG